MVSQLYSNGAGFSEIDKVGKIGWGEVLRLLVLTILFYSLSGLATPFKLTSIGVQEKVERDSTGVTTTTTTTYQVDDSPYEMVVAVTARNDVQVVSTKVFRGKGRGEADFLGFSLGFVNLKRGVPETATINKYGKFEKEAKGVGELVLQPILQLPTLKSVNAELGIDNSREMVKLLRSQGRVDTAEELNGVVMTDSHFGRTVAGYGFDVDPTATVQDPHRREAVFKFRKLGVVVPSRCWTLFPRIFSTAPPPSAH